MQEVNGLQFPSVWSDLFMEFEQGKMDSNPSIKVSDVPQWVQEYSHMDETYDYRKVEDLYKRGCELNCYLGAVYARVKGMHDQYELSCKIKVAGLKGKVAGADAKMAEAARERMVLVEPEYQEMHSLLLRMESMSDYVDALIKSFKPMLDGLQIRMRKEAKDQLPPLARG